MSQIPSSSEESGVRIPGSVVRLAYKKGMRRVTLQRVLTSLIVFQPEKVTLQELLCFFDNLIWCLEKVDKDPDFKRKFGETLEVLAKNVAEVRFTLPNFHQDLMKLSLALKEFENYYIPRRNLEGTYRHFRGHFHVLPYKESGTPNSEIPPKGFIGQGYRDKGARKDVAWDGTPSWQEVATSTLMRDLHDWKNYTHQNPGKD
jgi:hypothetical protein